MMTSGYVSVFSAYWFNTGYMSTSVLRRRLEDVHIFSVSRWRSDTEVDAWCCSPSYFRAMLGSTVAPGDDFVKLSVFSPMLGSTLDTWCCQSTWPFHRCSSWTRLLCPDPEVHHSGGAAVAVPLQVHQHPCRCAETASHGFTFQRR